MMEQLVAQKVQEQPWLAAMTMMVLDHELQLALYDWDAALAEMVAEQAPTYQPEAPYGYHEYL